MKVLLTSTSFQDTPGKHQELLKNQNYEVDFLRGPLTEDELLPIVGNYDAIICGDDEYTEKVLNIAKQGRLKYLSKYGVGLDKIDTEYAKKINIPVTNCPGVNQVSVAEHVLALLFAYEKNVHLQYNSTQKGSWKRLIGNEIQGQTIGIVGLGAVGKELAKKASALGMKVIGFDLYKDEAFFKEYDSIKFTSDLNVIFKESEVISLHVPHTPETEYLINSDVIKNKLIKKPIIINTARGMLVDIKALIKGLENGLIKGYLTDVLAHEPMKEDELLRGVEKVLITPHVGSRTYQSVERQGSLAVQNLINMIEKYS
tara:strand:- start:13917 stop:14858 length:942 start_codon:yes stop_codon:yes gene_type:complete